MLTDALLYQIVFLLIVSTVGVVLTVYDKIAAKVAEKHRVPEATLMAFGALGGALLMYLVMQVIRHKTRKPKFSAGFPVMILAHIAVLTVLNLWVIG